MWCPIKRSAAHIHVVSYEKLDLIKDTALSVQWTKVCTFQ